MLSLVPFSLGTKDYDRLFPYSRCKALLNTCDKNASKREAVKYFWCCINTEKNKKVKSRLKDRLFKPDL